MLLYMHVHTHTHTHRESGASLSDRSVERQNRLAMDFLRSQKRLLSNGPYGENLLCDGSGGSDHHKAPIFGQLIGGFKMATR